MKKIFIALVGLILWTGCNEDVLNLNNPAAFDEASYYKTQKECQEAVGACYSVFTMQPLYARDWYFIFDLLTGQAVKTAQLEVDLVQFDEFTYQPENKYIGWAWQAFYRMSLRSLVAIEKISAWETKTEAEAAYKEQMLGEAYFFYGYAYYFLTELWGDVPLHESWASIKEEPIKARMPYAEVQTKIEAAYQSAISRLPEAWDDNNLGRITKDAAYAMLGKLYLTRGENDKAVQAFESVKASEYHDDYYKLFVRGNHTSHEIILQVLHKFWGWGSGNAYYMWGGKENDGGKLATNCGRHMEYGWNDWGNVSVTDEAAAKFRYTVDGAAYLDPRNQSVMYGDGTMGDADFFAGDFPYRPQDGTSQSGYKWKKYCNYEDVEHMNMDDGDYSSILIRVADVKLLLAEAYIGLGNYDKAKALINEVRTRPAANAIPYNDVNANNAFEILKRERYIELIGEQQYWFDLVRWDRLGKINMLDELQSNATAKHKKFPIPTQEKDTNPLLVIQSEAWN
ncbi:MAG: RagB/SusD family nutrient uptake outer membrane protein [Tannerella sp.]|jgi:hypothetical protein|nr:RagB/SusD family nutrient uptake outer membrane protein [Tannerella sp.]